MGPFILLIILIVGYFIILNSKLENKAASLFEKASAALLASLIISLCLTAAIYTPLEAKEADVLYNSPQGYFLIYLSFFLPIYLIYGSISAYFIESKLIKYHSKHILLVYLKYLFAYILNGLLAAGIFLVLLSIDPAFSLDGLLTILGISVLHALFFYHIILILKLIRKLFSSLG